MKARVHKKIAFLVPALLTVAVACTVSAGTRIASAAGKDVIQDAATSAYVKNELYRNQTSFSPRYGWNNDPNGLLYVDGTYHAYFQYTYTKNDHEHESYTHGHDSGTYTLKGWDDMSWGHATSTDLVHWEEKSVAIPAYVTGDDGNFYAMMFSGSAVYDEYNSSGLFDTSAGKVVAGQGIVAVLTQPDESKGGQRQVLAYSKDGGDSFKIYGEVLGANAEGSLGDGEFRDPKVSWNADLNKWVMCVGGGAVRMYCSDNLKNWSYIGDTGYWGECPDLSVHTVKETGEKKYVLVVSPEDKPQSHAHNNTNRSETYYPAEYYVVGHLDGDGLFVGETPLKRLSDGIDSYAFQSFNNVPDGKVYGISWSASWKSVGQYERLRENYNGGLLMATEIAVIKENGQYAVTRNPVEGASSLRKNLVSSYDGKLGNKNVLTDLHEKVADVNIELDFSENKATAAELILHKSSVEGVKLTYDAVSGELTLDRSDTTVGVTSTYFYGKKFTANAPLIGGKLKLRIICDRAFISVYANDGRANIQAATFSAINADGFSLTCNGEAGSRVRIYKLASINGDTLPANDTLYVSTDKIDMVTGKTYNITLSSLADDFDMADVTYSFTGDGESLTADDITAVKTKDAIRLTAKNYGSTRLELEWKGKKKTVELYVYDKALASDLTFGTQIGGFLYENDNGLQFETGAEDAFAFSDVAVKDFKLTADLIPVNKEAQAGALMFGVSQNCHDYYVATVDYQQNKLKLWRAGVGDVKVVNLKLTKGKQITLCVEVVDGLARISVDGQDSEISYEMEGYTGGALGINVYNAKMAFNNIALSTIEGGEGSSGRYVGEREVMSVINVTDGNAILTEDDYGVKNGFVVINDAYFSKVEGQKSYTVKINTAAGSQYFTARSERAGVSAKLVGEADRDDGIRLELSTAAKVESVFIGNKEVEFVQEGKTVSVAGDAFSDMEGGQFVTLYTANGRAEVGVELPDFPPDLTQMRITVAFSVLGALAAVAIGLTVFILYTRRKKFIENNYFMFN